VGVIGGDSYFDTLRSMINESGASIAVCQPLLSQSYINGVTVFWTSYLSTSGSSELSDAERVALREWIIAGGTLIVTFEGGVDEYMKLAYESFLVPFNESIDVSMSTTLFTSNYDTVPTSEALAAGHPLVAKVNSVYFFDGYTFAVSDSNSNNATVLFERGSGPANASIAVVETGSLVGYGKLLITGDWNVWWDDYIGVEDNTQFVENVINWAALPTGNCPTVLYFIKKIFDIVVFFRAANVVFFH